MQRALTVLSLVFLLGFGSSSPGSTQPNNDLAQHRLNEEAYRHRFNREPIPDELTGIKVRGDVIIPLPQPLSPNWKMTVMTGDDSITAFDNARKKVAGQFADLGIDDAIQLSRASSQQTNGVRASSVQNFEKAMADHKITDDDGCLVYMTSHGSPQGFYIRGQNSLTPEKLNQILNDTCGKRPTIVLVSACYSGIFAEPKMEAPNRIILTAARKDKTSFGCSAEATYTYWDGCLVDTLPSARTWMELAQRIEKCIENKESGGGFARSYPQARFGADVKDLEIKQ
jgi:hypothetical protein